MRRWTMTLLLSVAAIAALAVAPRLVAHWSPPTPLPPVSVVPDGWRPELQVVPEVQVPALGVATPPAIPEVSEPASVPVVPPVPDNFWIDAVDCGMG